MTKGLWILEWSYKKDHVAVWLPFGLPHFLEEMEERLADVETRFPESNWRIVPIVVDKLTEKEYHQNILNEGG